MQAKPLRQASSIEHVFSSAYWHLSQQDFTIAEIRTKLERKTQQQAWIDSVLSQLIDNGYLKSDADFALRYCDLAISHQIGAGAIKRKLQQRGLSLSIIEPALETVVTQQKVNFYTMASHRLLDKFEHFAHTNKEKVYSHMINKGFSHAEITHALSQHPQQHTLRSKLAVKADSIELSREIIKLFNKGKGATLIKQELKQRLIDVTAFEETLTQLSHTGEIDFYQSCQTQLLKKRYDLTDYKDKSKAYAYLSRKGFARDEINHAMQLDD